MSDVRWPRLATLNIDIEGGRGVEGRGRGGERAADISSTLV